MKLTKEISSEDRKVLRKVFWRSWLMNASFTGVTQFHACGFLYSIMPAIKQYYPTKEQQAEAMVRHTTWFNCCLHVANFIVGLVTSMEKENSEKEDFDPQSIVAVKASLMGPLSGIGDSFFWGILRVVAASIGISLAATGSPIAAIIFLILYNVPAFIVHYYATYLGFSVGSSFLERLYAGGGMKILTKACSTVGLMMMGCMTATNVKFSTVLAVPVETGDPIMIQAYLDQLFKGLVPLCVTLACFYLMRKNVNVTAVLLGIFAIAIVCGVLGIV